MAKRGIEDADLVAEVKAKRTYLRSEYSTRADRFERLRQLYNLQFDLAFGWDAPNAEQPDDVRVIHTGPRKQTKHIKGLFVQHPPLVSVVPLNPTQPNDKMSGMLEDFAQGVMQANRQRNGDWFDDMVHEGLVTGWGVLFCGWNSDFEEEDTNGDYIGCPVIIKSVDPANVFYEMGGVKEQFQSVMYVLEKRLLDVERQWGVELDDSRQRLREGNDDPHATDEAEVEYIDYWWWQRDKKGKSKDKWEWHIYNAVIAGEDVIKTATKMPGYNTLPYIFWPSQPEPGWLPENLGLGTLWDMIEPLKNWCRVVNRKMRRLTYQADNVWVATARTRFDADSWEGITLDKTPGAVNPVPRGWDLRALVDVSPGEDADRLLQVFDGQVNQAGLPVMAMGSLPGGDTEMSGITMETVMDAATTWLATDTVSLMLAMRRMVELVFSLCAALTPHGKKLVVTNTKPATTVKSSRPKVVRVALSREDFVGFQVNIEIDTETMSDKMRKMQMGLQIKNLKPPDRPFSNRSIDERFFGVEDPDAELERKFVEEIREMPEVKQRMALAEAVKRRLPLPEDLMRQYREQQNQGRELERTLEGSGIMPPPGLPGMPPGMPSPGAGAPGHPRPGGGPPTGGGFPMAPPPGGGAGQMMPGPQPGMMPPGIPSAMPGGPMPVGNMAGPTPQGAPGPGQLPPELVSQLATVPRMPGPGQPTLLELLNRGR